MTNEVSCDFCSKPMQILPPDTTNTKSSKGFIWGSVAHLHNCPHCNWRNIRFWYPEKY